MDFASTGVAFTAGSFVVYWFAVFLASAMIAALVMTAVIAKKRYGTDDLAVDLCIVCIPCGILGGRLFAVLCGQIAFADFFRFSTWGLSLFGALFLCLAGIAVYCKIKKRKLLETLDLVTPALFTAIAIGRWGDCLHRTAVGPAVKNSAFKWFPLATFAQDNTVCFAPYFYTFLLCLALIVLYFTLFYRKTRKRGAAFLSLSALFVFVEFFIEWLRQDRSMLWGLRFNQWMCVLSLVGCALAYFLYVRKLTPETPSFYVPPQAPLEQDEDADVWQNEDDAEEKPDAVCTEDVPVDGDDAEENTDDKEDGENDDT